MQEGNLTIVLKVKCSQAYFNDFVKFDLTLIFEVWKTTFPTKILISAWKKCWTKEQILLTNLTENLFLRNSVNFKKGLPNSVLYFTKLNILVVPGTWYTNCLYGYSNTYKSMFEKNWSWSQCFLIASWHISCWFKSFSTFVAWIDIIDISVIPTSIITLVSTVCDLI